MKTETVISTGKFPMGRILTTPGARDAVSPGEITSALARHAQGDWGTVNQEDWKTNDEALASGGNILSAYIAGYSGKKFWIITESNRSRTTVLLPHEY